MRTRLFTSLLLLLFIIVVHSQTTEQGKRLYQYEKYTGAISVLKQVLEKNQNDIEAWYWLERAYQQDNEPGKAITLFSLIPASLSSQPLYKVIKGRLDLQKGDSLQAKSAFAEALGNSRKKDPSIQLAIAEANIEFGKGDISNALDLLIEVEKRDNKNPAVFIARGDAFRKLYNGSESFRNYQHALELDKKNPSVYYKIGKIYQTQNNEPVFTEYYENAIKEDPDFGPVYFQLYYYYYTHDPNKAFDNLQKFIAHSDPDKRNAYLLMDQYYILKKYSESIAEAKQIIERDGNNTRPRLYKLLARDYDALDNSADAEETLKKYFEKASDTSHAPEDFELMAKLLEQKKQNDQAAIWYEKAYELQKDSVKKAQIVRKLIAFNKAGKQYEKQAYWFDKLNSLKAPMTNVDLFSWGIASYNAKNYEMADSIFGMYETKYPAQTFGYYWRARSNAAMDTAMETGLAIPHYENLIKVAEKDTVNANNRKWLIQAYGYIAAFKVNKEKMYGDALSYYDKILHLDPANGDAEKYKGILEKIIETKATDKP